MLSVHATAINGKESVTILRDDLAIVPLEEVISLSLATEGFSEANVSQLVPEINVPLNVICDTRPRDGAPTNTCLVAATNLESN